MATSRYQVPAIPAGDAGTGPYFSSDTHNDGVQTVHKDKIVICDASGNIVDTLTTAPAGTERGIVTRPIPSGNQAVQGGPLATTSGTITTATGAVTSGDVGVYNNVTVVISGTYAGVNVIFEVSPDAGTTWVPIVGSRLDGTGTESTSGVLAANTTRGWEFTLPAVNRFRVRATAWTSGTTNVIVAAGTMPLEPIVNSISSKAPSQVNFSATTAIAGVALTTTDALISLNVGRAFGATAAVTSISLTAGKTLKLQSMALYLNNGATAAALRCTATLRINTAGAVTNASPAIAQTVSNTASVTAQFGGSPAIVPLDMDIPAGLTPAQIGVTIVGNAAGGLAWVALVGYEF